MISAHLVFADMACEGRHMAVGLPQA